MRIKWITMLLVALIGCGALAQDRVELTVASVDTSGGQLNGSLYVGLNTGGGYSATGSGTWTINESLHINITAKWGGLRFVTGYLDVPKDTTIRFDARTGERVSLTTPGIHRIEIVYEPIQVVGLTTDLEGAALPGTVVYKVQHPGRSGRSPLAWTMANGGTVNWYAYWGGLRSPTPSTVIHKDTTYFMDALTGERREQFSPGATECRVLFEPISVTGVAVDQHGDVLPGTFQYRVYHPGATAISPCVWTMANGGLVNRRAWWGGLRSDYVTDSRVFKDHIYREDALTHVATTISTPGVTRIEFVFEAIGITIATVNGAGNPIPGVAHFQVHPFNANTTWTATPWVRVVANGGLGEFYAKAYGVVSEATRDTMMKGTTYVLDGFTGDYRVESTPGLNRVLVVYSTNEPPEARAGEDQTIEGNTLGGALVTLDGSLSTDDGEIAPLAYKWIWTGGEVDGVSPEIFLPLGATQITLTVDDGEFTATDTVTITVVDTAPPEITVEVTPSVLWPPNHKMVPIEATVSAVDIVDPSPSVVLLSVISNEPDDVHGLGDGSFGLDIQEADVGSADFDFLVRAERAAVLEGRIYTIVYRATDTSGNVADGTVMVVVPHDVGGKKG